MAMIGIIIILYYYKIIIINKIHYYQYHHYLYRLSGSYILEDKYPRVIESSSKYKLKLDAKGPHPISPYIE